MQILEENSLDFTIIEYLKHPPTKKELKNISKALKLNPKNFIRKGEKIYKELCTDIDRMKSEDLYHLILKTSTYKKRIKKYKQGIEA